MLQDGLFQLQSSVVCSYALVEGTSVHLIDGGFWQHLPLFESLLGQLGLGWESICSVLLTHGHLDHTYNVHEIVRRSGATVYGHPADRARFAGECVSVSGFGKVGAGLEAVGRVFPRRYHPVSIDRWIGDGQQLDVWGGLHVVHTPGHTEGHCCFYSPAKHLLFAGDLFSCTRLRTALPPCIFNAEAWKLASSLERLRGLALRGVLANHCDNAIAEVQLERFRREFF